MTGRRNVTCKLLVFAVCFAIAGYNMSQVSTVDEQREHDDHRGQIASQQEYASVTDAIPPSGLMKPLEKWMYEPRNLNFFWKKMADRRFMAEFYPRLAKFDHVLDVGARGYNRLCKDMIHSNSTLYFQIEPHPPDEMNNDGLLHCTVQEAAVFYPQYKASFDVVVDFGVFGWDQVQNSFHTSNKMLNDIHNYVNGIRFLLKPNGIWILKVDQGWVPDEALVFENYIEPYFTAGSLDDTYRSGHTVKNKFRFFFLYKKEETATQVRAADETEVDKRSSTKQDLKNAISMAATQVTGADEKELSTDKRSSTKDGKNVIQLENERPGTWDWALTKPALNREIEGYFSHTSIPRGHPILLFYNTGSPSVSVEIFRTGWYNGMGARRYAGPVMVPGVVQDVPRPDRLGTVTCRWKDPYSVETASNWTTGVYVARMTETLNGTQSYAIFVVRDDDPKDAPQLTFQLPVNTYQAYNFWGGSSLYAWGSPNGKPGRKVSFDRPYAKSNNELAAYGNGAGEYLTNIQPIPGYPISSSAGWNYNMVRWLERNSIDVSYVTNVDVHTRLQHLSQPKLFLTQGHDEYWSWEMRDNVEAWRNEGVHLMFLGSNTAFWQIRYEDESGSSNKDAEPRSIVCYRRQRIDPIKTERRSVKWRHIRPEWEMVGVEYFSDPYDANLVVAHASHWAFNGTGVSNGDILPGLLGYEVDKMRKRVFTPKGGNRSLEIIPLFESPVTDRKNQSQLCHATIYTAESGANVFASGTMQWSWGLDDYNVQQKVRSSRLSNVVDVITRNLLRAAGIPIK